MMPPIAITTVERSAPIDFAGIHAFDRCFLVLPSGSTKSPVSLGGGNSRKYSSFRAISEARSLFGRFQQRKHTNLDATIESGLDRQQASRQFVIALASCGGIRPDNSSPENIETQRAAPRTNSLDNRRGSKAFRGDGIVRRFLGRDYDPAHLENRYCRSLGHGLPDQNASSRGPVRIEPGQWNMARAGGTSQGTARRQNLSTSSRYLQTDFSLDYRAAKKTLAISLYGKLCYQTFRKTFETRRTAFRSSSQISLHQAHGGKLCCGEHGHRGGCCGSRSLGSGCKEALHLNGNLQVAILDRRVAKNILIHLRDRTSTAPTEANDAPVLFHSYVQKSKRFPALVRHG
jgi:hypothetical protein